MLLQKAQIIESRQAVRDIKRAPHEVVKAYEIWARLVEEHSSYILRSFRGYNDKKLHGEWHGHKSCRLNKKWRVIYLSRKDGNIEIVKVVRVTAHVYRRKS